MRIDVVTLFPELFQGFLAIGMVGRGLASGALSVRLRSPRDFGLGRHRSVDDTPYGGGSGMVMRVDCLVRCLEALDEDAAAGEPPGVAGEPTSVAGEPAGAPSDDAAAGPVTLQPPSGPPPRARRVLLTPQGRPFCQEKAIELAARPAIALVCGRYEGFDERVRAFVDEEISLGDFVMTGGEVAAMAVIDACVRLLPGVLGNAGSTEHESHSPALSGLLEYPQYTRPVEFRGLKVPDVLQQGNHAAIARWRRAQAEQRTAERRPDLWRKARGGSLPPGEGSAPPGAGGGAR
ncbi:tRNA (guanine-N1)-methyltransferase [Sorangium cellulosum]|uniref:tRNA (guanine-N(1)-)-methyltransferase n=1 Tax=Sorangium cellulosum TaxID=56 RepID=A0A4P2Q420_SORCE|nr:tRNA (guanosine(37)-N1)-methyltransferase TrmD [Sorangium cellulosum]AUX23653.1 tRNA (guanine-N1)-methyltransferase [Sorangium cellulosum]